MRSIFHGTSVMRGRQSVRRLSGSQPQLVRHERPSKSNGCQGKSPCATAGLSAISTVGPSASALDWGAIKDCELESVGAIADVHQEVYSL